MTAKHKKKRHSHKRRELPEGMKVLIGYSSIIAFLYIFFGLLFPVTMLFGVLVKGTPALLFNLGTSVAVIYLIYGLKKRLLWAWKLALALYAFSILNSFVSLFFINNSPLNVISGFMTSASVFIILINLLTTWYVASKKDYFIYRSHKRMDMVDKVFISAIYLIYFFSLLFIIAIGLEFYKNVTFAVDVVMDELSGKTLNEAIMTCNEQRSGSDICYITLVALYKDIENPQDFCNRVESPFYKFTCLQLLTTNKGFNL